MKPLRLLLFAALACLPAAAAPVVASTTSENVRTAQTVINLPSLTALEVNGRLKVVFVQSKGRPYITYKGENLSVTPFEYTHATDGKLTLTGSRSGNQSQPTVYVYGPMPADIAVSNFAQIRLGDLKTNSDLTLRIADRGFLNTGDVDCRSLTLEKNGMSRVRMGNVDVRQDATLRLHGNNSTRMGDLTVGGTFWLEKDGTLSVWWGKLTVKGNIRLRITDQGNVESGDIATNGQFQLESHGLANVRWGRLTAKDDVLLHLNDRGCVRSGDISVGRQLDLAMNNMASLTAGRIDVASDARFALDLIGGITTGDLIVGGLFDLSQKNMHRAKLGQVECQTFRLAKESNTELDMGDLTADTDIQLTTTGIGRMTTGRLSTKGTLTLNCAQQTASSLGDIACRELRADLSGKCQLKLPAVEVKGDVSLAARDVSTITFTTLATDGDISVTRQNMATLSVGTLDCTTLTLHSSGDGWLNPESEKTKKAFLLVSRPGGGINITHMVNPSPYVIENKGKSTLEINPYSNDGNDIRFKDGYHIVLQKPSRQLTQLP